MKTKTAILTVVVLVNSFYSILAQPTLGIAPADNQSVLFWPTNPVNYVLQCNTNLALTNWVFPSDAVPATYGLQTAVAVTNTIRTRFFRLIQIPTTTADGMALIPAGIFTMGDILDEDTGEIPTNIYVSAFYMDVNLVTYGQWQTVYNWATNHEYAFDNAGSGKAANHPVQTVSYLDALKWCNARSLMAWLTPVYYIDTNLTQVYTNVYYGQVMVSSTANGYRLPTGVEWEKAARGGLSGHRFPWGDTISQYQANYMGATNSLSYDLGPNGYNPLWQVGGFPDTSPVGSFAANGYGLYDMAGNVLEFCLYAQLRGGNWGSSAALARCAMSQGSAINSAFSDTGFRCVRGISF
jgi:formylglycine-generating enzyme required for sulfatase activity